MKIHVHNSNKSRGCTDISILDCQCKVKSHHHHHCCCCCDDDGRSVSPCAARLFGVGAVTTLLLIHAWFITCSNGRRWLGSCRNNYTNTHIHTHLNTHIHAYLRADKLAGFDRRQSWHSYTYTSLHTLIDCLKTAHIYSSAQTNYNSF